MDKRILDFLSEERIGVITVLQPDGTPHSATVHFSFDEENSRFLFQTNNITVKAQSLLNNPNSASSLVIGFSEDKWKTLQARGNSNLVNNKDDVGKVNRIHFTKFPEAEKYNSPNTVFIEFKYTWFRYTDFNSDKELIIEG